MGFFAEFSTWLNGILATYIATNTANIASFLAPTIVTLAVVYVMIWGYLQLMGQIEEPFLVGVRRIVTLVVILGAALDLWLYNDIIVDTFFNAPSQLAAGIVRSPSSIRFSLAVGMPPRSCFRRVGYSTAISRSISPAMRCTRWSG